MKVHMKSVIDRDSIEGKTRTLCGRYLNDYKQMIDNEINHHGDSGVTCEHCQGIINNSREGQRR